MQRRVFVSTTTTAPVESQFRVYFPPGSHLRLLVRTPDGDSPHSYSQTSVNLDTTQDLEFAISRADVETMLSVAQDIPAQPPSPAQSPLPSLHQRGDRLPSQDRSGLLGKD